MQVTGRRCAGPLSHQRTDDPPPAGQASPPLLVYEGLGDGGERRENVELGPGDRLLPPAAGPGSEQGQQDREQQQAVEQPQQDHQEDHLGEGDDDVARVTDQREDAEDGGESSWNILDY